MPVAAIESFDSMSATSHGLSFRRAPRLRAADPSAFRTVLWPPSPPTKKSARTISPVESVASTPCSFCVNVASALPNSTSPPSARKRSRKIASVRDCGTIQRFG